MAALTPSSEFPLPWSKRVERRSPMRFNEKGIAIVAANGQIVRVWWEGDCNSDPAPTDAEIAAIVSFVNVAAVPARVAA